MGGIVGESVRDVRRVDRKVELCPMSGLDRRAL